MYLFSFFLFVLVFIHFVLVIQRQLNIGYKMDKDWQKILQAYRDSAVCHPLPSIQTCRVVLVYATNADAHLLRIWWRMTHLNMNKFFHISVDQCLWWVVELVCLTYGSKKCLNKGNVTMWSQVLYRVNFVRTSRLSSYANRRLLSFITTKYIRYTRRTCKTNGGA